MRIGQFWEDLSADLRFALRTLVKHWPSLAIAVSTLAIGMALVTMIFAVCSAALLKSPYANADRLHAITEIYDRASQGFSVASSATVQSLRHRARSFARVGASRTTRAVLGAGGEVMAISATEVDTALFPMLGVVPVYGRLPSRSEIGQNAAVVVLGDRVARRLAPHGNAIGRGIRIGSRSLVVIGVMPAGFSFPDRSDAWLPLDETTVRRGATQEKLSLLGQLRPQISPADAQQELRAIGEQLSRDDPVYYRGVSLLLRDEAVERKTRAWKPVLVLFMSLAIGVMAIGCLNVGNLLLMRAAERRTEFALRRVLGANMLRLARQLAVESTVVGSIAAVIAGLLTAWSLKSIDRIVPLGNMPGWFQLAPDLSVFSVLVLMMAVTVAFTSASVIRRVGRLDVGAQLAGGQTMTSANVARIGERAVVAQVILCTAIVVAASVLLGAYARVRLTPLGYQRQGLVQVRLESGLGAAPDTNQALATDRQLSQRLARNAAIEGEAREGVFRGFLDLGKWAYPDAQVYRIEDGANAATRALRPSFRISAISDSFFRVRGTELIAGRAFSPTDTLGSPKVAIVSRRLATALDSGQSPLGRQFRLGRGGPLLMIVGVAADVREPGTATLSLQHTAVPLLYLSDRQAASHSVVHWVRARSSVAAASSAVLEELRILSPGIRSFHVQEAPEPEGIMVLRVISGVLTLTGVIGLLMAILGIYAITEYAVIQRTRRIGIELALGAAPRRMYMETMRRMLLLIGPGLAVGLLLGAVVELAINPAFWGARAFSPVVYIGVSMLFVTAGLVASARAAHRAASVEPAIALRH